MKTAVLIDDDLDDLEILEEAIKQLDNSVRCISYHFCDDALNKILANSSEVPNYIFLDINMPRLDGNECLKKLRQEPKLKNVPIVMLSTSMSSPIAKTLKENGATFTFQKPVLLEDYEHILKPILIGSI